MIVAESIVKMLEAAGVEAVFTGSGQAVGNTLLALKHSAKIKTILTRHEQAASFMAYGYGLSSGKLAVCNAQGGPGSVNLLSGLGMALVSGVPLLSLSSYSSKALCGMGDLGEMSGQSNTPDSQKMFAATTKKTFLITKASEVCDIFEEAINLAYSNRMGPVHIDIDQDLPVQENHWHRDIHIELPKRLAPKAKDIHIFAERIQEAIQAGRKILLMIGNGCVRSGAGAELQEFVERYQLPFVFTMDGKGVIPENHPLCIGMSGVTGDPAARRAFKEAEVIIAVGNSFAKFQTWNFNPTLFDSRELLQINNDRDEISKVYKADFALIADAKLAIAALTKELSAMVEPAEKTAGFPHDRATFQPINYKGDKVHPGALARKIGEALPENALLLGDAGAHMVWLAVHAQLNRGQSYKNPGSFGPMASHTNAAIGYQLGAPNRRVIVGCGDGCYQMSGFELLTAVEHMIPIVWVIFNNGGFHSIKQFNMLFQGDEAFNDLQTPDFASYAKLCGANGYRVTKLEEFDGYFKEALASNMPSVIDVILDPEINMPIGFFHED